MACLLGKGRLKYWLLVFILIEADLCRDNLQPHLFSASFLSFFNVISHIAGDVLSLQYTGPLFKSLFLSATSYSLNFIWPLLSHLFNRINLSFPI